ncbi:hypothetical protein HDU86_005287 [Geranomyces michiganensis]|nr:hypothetical protein HDU86_005287 [Geranomyces michiganensis]
MSDMHLVLKNRAVTSTYTVITLHGIVEPEAATGADLRAFAFEEVELPEAAEMAEMTGRPGPKEHDDEGDEEQDDEGDEEHDDEGDEEQDDEGDEEQDDEGDEEQDEVAELPEATEPSLDHKLPPFNVCRDTILKIHNSYNHEKHTVTGYLPYELFYGKTDNNWNRSSHLPPALEEIFKPENWDQMKATARERMELHGAKAIARSLKQQRLARKMGTERIPPLKDGDTVLVADPKTAMKARSKGRVRWVAVGKIVKGRSEDKFKIRWVSQGPNKADLLDTVSTRSFGRQYLGRPSKDCSDCGGAPPRHSG